MQLPEMGPDLGERAVHETRAVAVPDQLVGGLGLRATDQDLSGPRHLHGAGRARQHLGGTGAERGGSEAPPVPAVGVASGDGAHLR